MNIQLASLLQRVEWHLCRYFTYIEQFTEIPRTVYVPHRPPRSIRHAEPSSTLRLIFLLDSPSQGFNALRPSHTNRAVCQWRTDNLEARHDGIYKRYTQAFFRCYVEYMRPSPRIISLWFLSPGFCQLALSIDM